MWKKITQTSNKVVPEAEVKPWKKKKRHTTVVRASKTMSNQEFLAVAVMEGDLEKVKNVLNAYSDLFGTESFHVVTKFLYEINPRLGKSVYLTIALVQIYTATPNRVEQWVCRKIL